MYFHEVKHKIPINYSFISDLKLDTFLLLFSCCSAGGGKGNLNADSVAKIKYMMSHDNAEEVMLIEGDQLTRKIYNNHKLAWQSVNAFDVPSTKDWYIGQWQV